MLSKILPFIIAKANDQEESKVSVQKLSKLIDAFCFYPIKVAGIKNKNSSDQFTAIYDQNQYGRRTLGYSQS